MNKKWIYVLSGFTLIAILLLHFVPIKEEAGFIADANSNPNEPATCELTLEERRYRLIFGGASTFNKTKSEFTKYDSRNSTNAELLKRACVPGIETTIKLYVF